MISVAILGASGYTALELIKILLRHPEVRIDALTSRQEDRPHISAVHPELTGRLDLCLEPIDVESLAARVQCVFSCLPHAASAETVKPLVDAGVRVIDFSADYRLTDRGVYEQWYGRSHPDPQRIGQVPYGLPELYREQLSDAPLIANPGCFPTSAILALAPLLKAGEIAAEGIVVDSKSGVSGAGRTPKLTTLFPECNESIMAYNVGQHRHTPEIDQVLSACSASDVQVVFTPHLTPMDRGILSACYARPTAKADSQRLLTTLREFYAGEPFVRVVEHLPATRHSAHTNYCDLTVRVTRDTVIVISCLDNLLKGASGAAVQNFNLMFGLPETLGF